MKELCNPDAEGLEGHLGRKGWYKEVVKGGLPYTCYSLQFQGYTFELVFNPMTNNYTCEVKRKFFEFEGMENDEVVLSRAVRDTPRDALSFCSKEFENYLEAQLNEMETMSMASSKLKSAVG